MFLFQTEEKLRQRPVERLANAIDQLDIRLKKALITELENKVPGFKGLTPYKKDIVLDYINAEMMLRATEKHARLDRMWERTRRFNKSIL